MLKFSLILICLWLSLAMGGSDCTPESTKGQAKASCTLNGTVHKFDLTKAFTNGDSPFLTSDSLDDDYVFYVTAIHPGLNSELNLSLCKFADGFTDSNSGAQVDNRPDRGTCWSTGDINAETWTYDADSETMTIESVEGQDDRKTKLTVVCSNDTVPIITTLPEDPPKEYNFKIKHNSVCLPTPTPPTPSPGTPCQLEAKQGVASVICQIDGAPVGIDVTAAFVDCDGTPYLTSYGTDNTNRYLVSTIWLGVPHNITGCKGLDDVYYPIIEQSTTDAASCNGVGSLLSTTSTYNKAVQTLNMEFASSRIAIICSDDIIPRISYVPGLQAFQIHHKSVCQVN